jgi:hypothetical protein
MVSRGRSKYDALATLTYTTAMSIAEACKLYLPSSAKHPSDPDMNQLVSRDSSAPHTSSVECSILIGKYLSGGGSLNPTLISYISALLPHTEILPLSLLNIPAEAKEAISFALLGFECILGRPIFVPQHVDSRKEVILGKITPGVHGWVDLIGKVGSFAQGRVGSEWRKIESMVVEKTQTL